MLPSRPLVILAFALSLVACGGSSPTAPAPPPAAPTPTAPAPPPPPPSDPTVVRSATFQGANGYRTRGSAVILNEGDGTYALELGDDFVTDNTPALEVRLCLNGNCNGDNRNLGSLQSPRGQQIYELSDPGTEYSHVVIWCSAVNQPFGFGELQ